MNKPLTIEEAWKQRIKDGLDELEVSYGEQAIDKLVLFMKLLSEWNETHNLTAINDVEQMISLHIFDCASIKPYIKGASMLDVGSGAGLPGMVWAILSPALQVTSVEARNKKAQFQMFAANKLQLKNFTVVNERIEDYKPSEPFAMITARAFSDLANLVELSKHTISPNGRWLALKGVFPDEELKEIKKRGLKHDTFALKVPDLVAQRNLVVIRAPKK